MNDESPHNVEIYQLRAYLRQISPLIWRRLLVRSDSTIADLHFTLQIAFGWSDLHLHQFIIRGKHYGIAYAGGISFSDDPRKVELKEFHFRPKERFLYEYNFFAHWEYEVRVEKIVSLNARKTYPICIGGARAAPPEDCGGPWAFMSLTQDYSPFYIKQRLLEIVEDEEKTDEEKVEDCREELAPLKYWLNAEQLDRRTVNQWLRRYAVKEEGWEEAFEEVVI